MKDYHVESEDQLNKLLSDFISDEQLMTTSDEQGDVSEFVKNVFGICSEAKNMKHFLINDFLLGKFKESKRGGGISQQERHRLLHLVLELVLSDKAR